MVVATVTVTVVVVVVVMGQLVYELDPAVPQARDRSAAALELVEPAPQVPLLPEQLFLLRQYLPVLIL